MEQRCQMRTITERKTLCERCRRQSSGLEITRQTTAQYFWSLCDDLKFLNYLTNSYFSGMDEPHVMLNAAVSAA